MIQFSGGGEDKLTELVDGFASICRGYAEFFEGTKEFSCYGFNLFLGGENVGGESVFGDDPEVAFLFTEGVLQEGSVGVEELLFNLGYGEGLGIFEGGVFGDLARIWVCRA